MGYLSSPFPKHTILITRKYTEVSYQNLLLLLGGQSIGKLLRMGPSRRRRFFKLGRCATDKKRPV